jgi:two-component system, chemotaxis family, CheB/CheR fusion protein
VTTLQQSEPHDGAALDVLLDYLKRTRGFDFTGYKRSSLERRIEKRMNEVGIGSYQEYLDYLEVQSDEFAFLFNTILINVTGFFRDAAAWDYLATEVIPRLVETVGGDRPLRFWCAGCSSGEETYTMAMVLAEALGEQQYLDRVKIYATDVDEEALTEARHATYAAKAVEAVPPPLLERYFERVEQRYAFRKELRRTVIFGRNDLVQDAPISRIDLLICRNTLMYFNAETQAGILGRFHFSLNDWGYLYLGKSEMLITHSDLFKPVDLKRRVFAKVVRPTLRDRLLLAAHPDPVDGVDGAGDGLRESAFDAATVAQLAVDLDGTVVLANQLARTTFGLSNTDVGRSLKDLEISYRPVDLRSNIEAALAERRTVVVTNVSMTISTGDVREFEVQLTPLHAGDRTLGTTVTFTDVTVQHRVQKELEDSKRELESAYEELQSTVEELETTNEELQSTNEELETTNEELQSTNEELETTNEELQSTNEELETMNDELRQRTLELNEVNAFLETILTSMGVGVAVLDRSLAVQVWNAHSSELWGLRSDEAEGENLLSLDVGLPVEKLSGALRDVLNNGESRVELRVEATNRRGRPIDCRIVALPLSVDGQGVSGTILLMEELGERTDGG